MIQALCSIIVFVSVMYSELLKLWTLLLKVHDKLLSSVLTTLI